PDEVHGHDGVLTQAAALHEHNGVVGGHVQQLAQIGLGLVADLNEMLAPMAHFHHGHAAAVPVQHLGGNLLQHRLGQGRRACREIPGASHYCSVGSVGSVEAPDSPSPASVASVSSSSTSARSEERRVGNMRIVWCWVY